MVALDDAGEALAVRRRRHVDLLADLEDVHPDRRPLEVREPRSATRNSLSIVPASTPALAKWPAAGLLTRLGAALAEGDLHGGIAVGVRRLDLGDAVVRHVHDGHRDGVAIVGEDAGHADLAADESETHVLPFCLGNWSGFNWPGATVIGCCGPRPAPRRTHCITPFLAATALQLDLHVHARRQVELHQRVHRLVGRDR